MIKETEHYKAHVDVYEGFPMYAVSNKEHGVVEWRGLDLVDTYRTLAEKEKLLTNALRKQAMVGDTKVSSIIKH